MDTKKVQINPQIEKSWKEMLLEDFSSQYFLELKTNSRIISIIEFKEGMVFFQKILPLNNTYAKNDNYLKLI